LYGVKTILKLMRGMRSSCRKLIVFYSLVILDLQFVESLLLTFKYKSNRRAFAMSMSGDMHTDHEF